MSPAILPGAVDVAADSIVPTPSPIVPQATKHDEDVSASKAALSSIVPLDATMGARVVGDAVATSVISSKASATTPRILTLVVPALIGTVTLVCFTWTLLLLAFNIAPNTVVNRIMDTEEFEHGTFWLLIDPSPSLLAMAAISLAPAAIAYAFVLVTIAIGGIASTAKTKVVGTTVGTKHRQSRTASMEALKHKIVASIEHTAKSNRDGSRSLRSAARLVSDLSRSDSSSRKLANAWIKLVDLSVQVVLLFQLMERGMPRALVGLFAAIVSINALVSVLLMLTPRHWPTALIASTHATFDTMFDFFIVVGHPMIVVIYCLAMFSFDRRLLGINNEVFPTGAFETGASVMADREQVAIILEALFALRIYSPLRLFTCLGSNIMLCHRLHRLMIIWRSRHGSSGEKRVNMVELYPRRHPITVVFLLFAFAVVVTTEESVRTSTAACSYHPECSVHAWRWTLLQSKDESSDGYLRQCPCLTMIDAYTAPATFAEWENPKDVADKVAQLATTGDLQTLQLINRKLSTLPVEMRHCKRMKHLSLVYSQTTSLPDWAKELTMLEFLHIEGSPFGFLTYLPDDLFEGMNSLTNIHLGFQPALQRLPRFDGLIHAHSITLAIHLSLTELPPFDPLGELQSLLIIMCPMLDSLPDMTPLVSLRSFVTIDRGTFCCNGFRDEPDANVSTCDLSHSMCGQHPMWGTPPAECLRLNRTDKLMSPATRSFFEKFSFSVCVGEAVKPGELDDPATPSDMLKCNGTMFRECVMQPGDRKGMCYNPRMMPISCDSSPFPMEMRRRQIQERLGEPCDPEYEAWLGCEA